MTVLVLDNPELIARAAALEAAQTRTQVPEEDARVKHEEAKTCSSEQAFFGEEEEEEEEDSSPPGRANALALVV